MYDGDIVSVEIPASVELTIAETEPGVQGDRVSGARKPATLETGKVDPGAAVRQHAVTACPRRHPHRRVHRPGCEHGPREDRALRGAGAGAAAAVRSRRQGRRNPRAVRGGAAGGARPAGVACSSRAWRIGGPRSTRCSPITPQGWTLERMPVIDRTVPAHRHLRAARPARRAHRRRHRRGGGAGQALLHRRLRPVRQRHAGRHRQESACGLTAVIVLRPWRPGRRRRPGDRLGRSRRRALDGGAPRSLGDGGGGVDRRLGASVAAEAWRSTSSWRPWPTSRRAR